MTVSHPELDLSISGSTSSDQWRIQLGGGSGGYGPPYQTWSLQLWDWNSYIDRIVHHFLTGWFFLMKRAWHSSTKLNARNIKKCHCFWVPSYDLIASVRKAVFPEPTATGVHRMRNTWSSLLSQLVDNYGDNSADNHVPSTGESTDGTVHSLQQSRFESQCSSRMQVNFSQKHDWNLKWNFPFLSFFT